MHALNEINYVNQNDENLATKKEVEALLQQSFGVDANKDELELIDSVKQNFPVTMEKLAISGSEKVIQNFNLINNKKFDHSLDLAHITNIDFIKSGNSNKYELSFDVLATDSNEVAIHGVKTIYNAKKQFLDDLFEINRFTDFMLKKDNKQLVLDTINDLRTDSSINERKMRYRFIENDEENLLRTIVTTDRYKRYDNAIILYIGLVSIAELTNEFSIDNMIVTDSKLRLNLLEREETQVSKDATVSTGISISNSELADEAATFNAIYRISNDAGKKFMVMGESIAKVNHGYTPKTVSNNLKKLLEFKNHRTDIIEAVKKVDWTRTINENDILKIMGLISHLGNNVPKDLKEKMRANLDEITIAKKAFNLLDVFDKLDGFLSKEDAEIRLIMEGKFAKWIGEGRL